MPEFAEVLDRIAERRDNVRNMFEGDGVGVRTGRRGRKPTPMYLTRLARTADFLAEVVEGYRSADDFREAMSTSDFPLLFADVLDRQVLAAYREWPAVWPSIAQRRVVNDFRSAKLYPPPTGADSRLPIVRELSEYTESALTEQAPLTLSAAKYGRRLGISWESLINDDMNQIRDFPMRLGRAARRTESRAVVELYVGTAGPLGTLYTNGNHNIVNTTNGASANNPPLTIAGMQDAWKVLSGQVDEVGEPIFLEMVTLVVPPALEVTARNILNATQIEITASLAGGSPNVARTDSTPSATGEQRLMTANWMRNNVKLVIDPYIPATATGSNGNTSWFLFADPGVGRAALTIAFLRGHEEPEIWIKDSNARLVGGGDVNPLSGDFDTDTIQYRIRHVLGVATIDPKSTVASNGSGS